MKPYIHRTLYDMMDMTDNFHRLNAILEGIAKLPMNEERQGVVAVPIPGTMPVYSGDDWNIAGDEHTGMIYAVRMNAGVGVSVIEFSLGIWQLVIADLDTVDPEIALRERIASLETTEKALRAQIKALNEANGKLEGRVREYNQKFQHMAGQLYAIAGTTRTFILFLMQNPYATMIPNFAGMAKAALDASNHALSFFPKTSATPLGTKDSQ